MFKVEENFNIFVNYIYNTPDSITALFWARRTLEQMLKAAVKKGDPKIIKFDRLDSLIKIVEKKKLANAIEIPHMRVVQNFGNTGAHDSDLLPEDVDVSSVLTVEKSLDRLYLWYKKDIEPSLKGLTVPVHNKMMNKELNIVFQIDEDELLKQKNNEAIDRMLAK